MTELTITWTSLVFFAATQDIAVDGWALTLLSDEAKAYASTAQTIGLNTGYFASYTVFLALNSEGFSYVFRLSPPRGADSVQEKIWLPPPIPINISPVLVCCVLLDYSVAVAFQERGKHFTIQRSHSRTSSTGGQPA